MRNAIILYIFAITLLIHNSASGQDTADTRASLSGLHGVAIYVVPPADELAEAGVTALVLAVEVERCLKEAGIPIIYPAPPDTVAHGPTLLLEVTALLDTYINQSGYTIRLDLVQAVYLERDSTLGLFSAPTWGVGGMGFYRDGWRQAMIGDIVAFTNRFADAYTGANPPLKE